MNNRTLKTINFILIIIFIQHLILIINVCSAYSGIDDIVNAKLLQYKRDIPDSTKSTYIEISETQSIKKQNFNHFYGHVKSVSISGKKIIIDKNNGSGDLYKRFFNGKRNDILELKIYAETLIIRIPVYLPKVNVEIYANYLRFEDLNENTSKICTKPLKNYKIPDMSENGEKGLKGGNISLYINHFYSDSGIKIRFELMGGDGQNAGSGSDGSNGDDLKSVKLNIDWAKKEPYGGHIIGFRGCTNKVYGQSEGRWPGDGKNANPSGRSGAGGDGGDFYSTINLPLYVNQSGGLPGKPFWDDDETPEIFEGGREGNPNPAYWFSLHCGKNKRHARLNHSSYKGKSAAAGLSASFGEYGRQGVINDKFSWFHPYLVTAVVNHAKDAYLNGNLLYVRKILSKYLDIYKNFINTNPERNVELEQLSQEIQCIVNRIDNNLDYFGNPGGWVPMLSFQATMQTYKNEIKTAIKILYLTYWLKEKGNIIKNRISVLEETRRLQNETIKKWTENYNSTIIHIPRLRQKSIEIENKILFLQDRLNNLEEVIRLDAEETVHERHNISTWEKSFKTASTICKVIPVYQPALGAVGVGFDFVANMDGKEISNIEDVVDRGRELNELINHLQDKDGLMKNSKEFKGKLDKINLSKTDTKRSKEYIGSLIDTADYINTKYKSITDINNKIQAPANEIEAVLNNLKVEHDEWNSLISDIDKLNVEKELFQRELSNMLNSLSTFSTSISDGMISYNELSSSISNKTAKLDHNTIMALDKMESRAKERLIYYQYLMIKGYEYRMLSSYKGSFGIHRLFDKLKELSTDENVILTETMFDTLLQIYEEELRSLATKVIKIMTRNAPPNTLESVFYLNKDELKMVNNQISNQISSKTSNYILLNLKERKGVFNDKFENIRIRDIQVLSVTTNNNMLKDNIQISLEHLGNSLIERKGNIYRFLHKSGPDDTPISWDCTYNSLIGTPSNSDISPHAESLLLFLLDTKDNPSFRNSVSLFSCPSAWADLKLEISCVTHENIEIKSIIFKVLYEYSKKSF